jgi:nitrogen fixation NifU-like protein
MNQPPDVQLDGLYGDAIMDHYRNPRHRIPVPAPDIEAEEFNPFCGDRVTLQIKLNEDGRVARVSSRSEGCSIIQATASMMSEVMQGKTLAELSELSLLFRRMMQGNPPGEEPDGTLGDLVALQVVRRYPVRIKCALLPWMALEEGIEGVGRQRAKDKP